MIRIQNVSKQFQTAEGSVEALKDVSLTIPDGDIFGIIGMSGAGKSTLVRCINMLERPTEGTIEIDGVDLCKLSEKKLRSVRREITMIFQGFNLLMQRNCLKNVCFPLELAGISKAEAKKERRNCWKSSDLATKQKRIQRSFPADSSSGLRLPVPLRPTPRCFCVMRQPVHWIQLRPTRYWS